MNNIEWIEDTEQDYIGTEKLPEENSPDQAETCLIIVSKALNNPKVQPW